MSQTNEINELKKQIEELEKAVGKKQSKRSGLLITSGILVIISTSIICFISLFYLSELQYLSQYLSNITSYNYYFTSIIIQIIMGILGIIAFSFGLTAAIFTLKRSHKYFSIFGVSFLFAISIPLSVYPSVSFMYLGIPSIILTLLGLIFLGVGSDNFQEDSPITYEEIPETKRVPNGTILHKGALFASIVTIVIGFLLLVISSQLNIIFLRTALSDYMVEVTLWVGVITLIIGGASIFSVCLMNYFNS